MGNQRKQRLGPAAGLKLPRRAAGSKSSTSPSGGPLSIKRDSLIAQTASSLREHIQARTWMGTLPGERRLCELLMVSRPTLRNALTLLQREGLLEVSQGKHRAIRENPAPHPIRKKLNSLVTILCPDTPSKMHQTSLFLIDEIYSRLQKARYQLTIQSPSWLNFRRPEKHLDQFVKTNPSACWALFGTSEAVQRWFATNPVRSLVAATCYPGVRLPNVDVDGRSSTKHAVGMFLRHGYRNITFLLPEKVRPGHDVAHQAFVEAISQSRHPGTTGRMLRVSASRHTFERQLNEHLHFKSGPHALLIAQTLDTLFATTYLLRRGIRLGTQVGLICQGDEPFLEHMSPIPARYKVSREKFAAKYCRLLLQLAQSGTIPIKSTLISTDFQPGETLQDAEGYTF